MEIKKNSVQTSVFLKSLLFCTRGWFNLDGQQQTFENLTDPSQLSLLPPAPPLDLSTLSKTLLSPPLEPSEVPVFFGSSPLDSPLIWHCHPSSETIAHCLQYAFSDGVVISAKEIFYHPYVNFIHKRLLPLTSQIQYEVHETDWLSLLPEHKTPTWGSQRQAEIALISVLIRSRLPDFTTESSQPISAYLTLSQDRSLPRTALALVDIHIGRQKKGLWKLTAPENNALSSHALGFGEATLSILMKKFSPDGKLAKGYEVDPKNQSLIFHPFLKGFTLTQNTLHEILGKTPEQFWKYDQLGEKIVIPLQEHAQIQAISKELGLRLKSQGFLDLEKQAVKALGPDCQTTLWLESNGTLRFARCFEAEEKSLTVWNIPWFFQELILGIDEGWVGIQRKIFPHQNFEKKISKKDRDAKIIKHSGFYALVLFETIGAILDSKNQKSLDSTLDLKKELAPFFDQLFKKCGNLFLEIEKKSGFYDTISHPTFDKLASKTLVESIKSFCIHLFQQASLFEEVYFTSQGEVKIQAGVLPLLRLFHVLLSKTIHQTRGQCLLKTRWRLFEMGPDWAVAETNATTSELIQSTQVWADWTIPELNEQEIPSWMVSYHAQTSWSSHAQWIQNFCSLKNYGFQLFYCGKPLLELKQEEFKPEFLLLENSQDSPVQQGGSSIDWFELHPKFFFQGIELSENQLQPFLKNGLLEFQGKMYLVQGQLPSLKRLEEFWSKIQTKNMKEGERDHFHSSFFRIPKSSILEILAIRASGVSIQGDSKWKQMCNFYDCLDLPRSEFEPPSSLRASLKPYQKRGVQWLLDLYNLGLGGILADDMGLGKTIQALSFLEVLRTQNELGKVLIVVPTSLTYNWLSEAQKFTPDLSIQIFQSKQKEQHAQFIETQKKAAVLIVTYGLFTEHSEFFNSIHWNILIFDEAQNLKNLSSKRTTASRKTLASFKLCLTGTPLENHLGEFYSLLDLVVSGSLGDIESFREKFVTPDTVPKEDLLYLKLRSKPLILRRTKNEILKELPPKIESTLKLPFEKKQEKIYRDIALSWNEKVRESILNQGEAKSQLLMLTALLRLRQVCSDPASIPNISYPDVPPKVNLLIEAVEEITSSGESALIFTQFLQTFQRIKKELEKLSIPSFSLHGGTSRPDREKILQQFQEYSKGSVLLMTLKTGGVGLNLIKASYVFHLEPWWNPAVENQATDRAHRIGQKKPVQVYRYLMRESVEEKIELLKKRKLEKFDHLFSTSETETENFSGGVLLSQNDFSYLLGEANPTFESQENFEEKLGLVSLKK